MMLQQSFEEGEKKPVAVGPWGGQDGFRWDDGVYSTVRQLVITHGAGIDSIQIEYDKKGTSMWSEKHGGNGGNRIDKVKLDYPDEFLTSIHGHYGTYFSFPMTGGKIVGFHGKSGLFLDAIGIYLKPVQQQKSFKSLVQSKSLVNNGAENIGYSVIQGSAGNSYDIVVAVRQKDEYGSPLQSKPSRQISRESSDSEANEKTLRIESLPSKPEGLMTYGPWGGTSGGSVFDDGTYTGIRQIYVSRNIGIVYIRVQYDRDGQAVWGSKHGGTGGFKTDKGKHGPFGEEQGPSFSNKPNEGKIVGFHGREGFFLDAIGVHVMEGKVKPAKHYLSDAIVQAEVPVAEIDNSPWSNKLVVAKRGPTEEVACSVVKEPAPCGPGPWGGDGGRPWDDGVFSGIKQIFITRAEAICSIQIEYDRNGQSVWSVKHGGSGGTATNRVKLEFPHEVLIRISGYYGPVSRYERPVVKSLTFYTSRGQYGPFGEEIGTYFTSTTTEGKVVGFHGKCGAYLDAIGVHMQHWLGNTRTSRSSLFKIFS
ncbi:hypothetical protein GH714_015711 [Hevea brasiliensis]|uniref:Jacalin-type lectin domain-containing protein n=1 Tax=Hevea brasiliensis TaxID=3981 RepID=A0A6A6NHS0_HEVBR|nr:hypothetical protein GH714_015711 [Hevea brasiliensis]